MNNFFILITFIILTTACSSTTTQKGISLQIYESAATLLVKGQSALANAQYDRAIEMFYEAHRLYVSIDNLQGMASSKLDIAHAFYKAKRLKNSLSTVDELLNLRFIENLPHVKSEALLLKSLILLANDNLTASHHIAKALLNTCIENLCKGKALNLLARIELYMSNFQSSAQYTLEAIATLSDFVVEKSNAHRLHAEALIFMSRYEDAITHLQIALQIDKSAEKTSKIKTDLVLLSIAYSSLSLCHEAIDVWQRARLIADDFEMSRQISLKAQDSINKCFIQSKKN